MNILLVEDEEFNLIVLEEMINLFYSDVVISTAINGQIAYEVLQETTFDLILSDINMPIMDGYELIKKVKNELKIDTTIIAVTAFAIQGDREKLLLAGFDDYVSKPIDMGELEKVLKKHIID